MTHAYLYYMLYYCIQFEDFSLNTIVYYNYNILRILSTQTVIFTIKLKSVNLKEMHSLSGETQVHFLILRRTASAAWEYNTTYMRGHFMNACAHTVRTEN